MVRLVQRQVDEHFSDPLCLRDLADIAHYTPGYLNTIFKRNTGRSLHQYLLDVRLRHARDLLADTDLPVKRVAYECGFGDPLYFSRLFSRRHGCPPGQWRRAGGDPR